MNTEQFNRMKDGKGFVAALDQSGGSTPKALKNYGIHEDQYKNEDEMFELVHEMRKRIITDQAFQGDRVLAAILFKVTMNSKIGDKYTADYLWEDKNVIPILKVDEGLAPLENGVQMMKPMEQLDDLLEQAKEHHIFGTKMRSVIKEYNKEGIQDIVKQQFEIGKKIAAAGFVPILEPEVDIHAPDKKKIEGFLKEELIKGLKDLPEDTYVMFKLTLPEEDNLYQELTEFPQTLRVVALSGGYTRADANEKLARNHNMIASFSRGLTEGLTVSLSDQEFTDLLDQSIEEIYQASIA